MRYIIAVALLGAICVIWAAVPLGGTGTPGVLLLVVAAICICAGLLRLVRKDTDEHERYVFPGVLGGLANSANDVLLRTGWETGAAVSVVVLEALHPSRPWHTGLLAIAVVCYLLAVHQAESAIPATVFRGQGRVLLASMTLVVVATAVAMIPASSTQSGWLGDPGRTGGHDGRWPGAPNLTPPSHPLPFTLSRTWRWRHFLARTGAQSVVGAGTGRTGRTDEDGNENTERECAPIAEVHANVPQEQHEQEGRRKSSYQEKHNTYDKCSEHEDLRSSCTTAASLGA